MWQRVGMPSQIRVLVKLGCRCVSPTKATSASFGTASQLPAVRSYSPLLHGCSGEPAQIREGFPTLPCIEEKSLRQQLLALTLPEQPKRGKMTLADMQPYWRNVACYF